MKYRRTTKGGGGYGVEGLSKMAKGFMDTDNSMGYGHTTLNASNLS